MSYNRTSDKGDTKERRQKKLAGEGAHECLRVVDVNIESGGGDTGGRKEDQEN